MCSNRHLVVSFSNGVNWNGVMSVEWVQKQADDEFPDINIELLISEDRTTEDDTTTIKHICRRTGGKWLKFD